MILPETNEVECEVCHTRQPASEDESAPFWLGIFISDAAGLLAETAPDFCSRKCAVHWLLAQVLTSNRPVPVDGAADAWGIGKGRTA